MLGCGCAPALHARVHQGRAQICQEQVTWVPQLQQLLQYCNCAWLCVLCCNARPTAPSTCCWGSTPAALLLLLHYCNSSSQLPKVFSPLYVMYKNPSSSLWSSYTDDMRAAAEQNQRAAEQSVNSLCTIQRLGTGKKQGRVVRQGKQGLSCSAGTNKSLPPNFFPSYTDPDLESGRQSRLWQVGHIPIGC